MQSNDARNLFQSEASLAQGRARAAKAKRTAHGAIYGRPIWLGGNDDMAVSLSDEDGGSAGGTVDGEYASAAMLARSGGDAPFVSLAGKDESAGAAFDGGKTRVLSAILDPTPDGHSAHLLTAESGALIRRLDLESGKAVQLFRGHTAPLMALAILDLSTEKTSSASRRRILFSSGWDKSIRAWPLYDGDKLPAKINAPLLVHADAASDFIKALLVVPSTSHPVILSGGSDRKIRIWSLASLQRIVLGLDDATWLDPVRAARAVAEAAGTLGSGIGLQLLGTFGEHTRPITALILFPTRPDAAAGADDNAPIVFSADSLGRIAQSELLIQGSAVDNLSKCTARLNPVRELKGNDASIGALHVGWLSVEVDGVDEEADEDAAPRERWEARLWSASRDRSAHAYTIISASGAQRRPPPAATGAQTGATSSRAALQFGKQEPLLPDLALLHPDYVTAVLDLNMVRRRSQPSIQEFRGSAADMLKAHTFGEADGVPSILTACSDEQLRIWTPTDHTREVSDRSQAKVFDVHGNAVNGPSHSRGAHLVGSVEGHWHEISVVGAWWRQVQSAEKPRQGEWWIASASYDGSVRRWSLAEFVKIARDSQEVTASASDASIPDPPVQPSTKAAGGVQLTAEEEAELAELMDSDDEL